MQVDTQTETPVKRELDELAARVEEKVFGRQVRLLQITPAREEWRSFDPDFSLNEVQAQEPQASGALILGTYSSRIPPYASREHVAFNKVVDVMVARGFWLKVTYAFTANYGCWAYFDPQGVSDSNPLYRGHGSTMQEAILPGGFGSCTEQDHGTEYL